MGAFGGWDVGGVVVWWCGIVWCVYMSKPCSDSRSLMMLILMRMRIVND